MEIGWNVELLGMGEGPLEREECEQRRGDRTVQGGLRNGPWGVRVDEAVRVTGWGHRLRRVLEVKLKNLSLIE